MLLWVAMLALSAAPNEGAVSASSSTTPPSAAAEKSQPPARTGRELEDAARAALRHWVRASDKDAATAARELLGIYDELRQDTSLSRGHREELGKKVRCRLAQLAAQISRGLARQSRQSAGDPQSVRVAKDAKVLGQVGRGGQGGAGMAAGGQQGGNAASGPEDAGEDLVDLIQTVIAPKSWESNGGPGTIYYWRIQRAIVVRNTSEVHEQISDTLEQLNRANH